MTHDDLSEAVLDMLSGAAPLPPLRRQAVDHVKYLPREGLDHPHLTAAQGRSGERLDSGFMRVQ